jgi:hypothetical protein
MEVGDPWRWSRDPRRGRQGRARPGGSTRAGSSRRSSPGVVVRQRWHELQLFVYLPFLCVCVRNASAISGDPPPIWRCSPTSHRQCLGHTSSAPCSFPPISLSQSPSPWLIGMKTDRIRTDTADTDTDNFFSQKEFSDRIWIRTVYCLSNSDIDHIWII